MDNFIPSGCGCGGSRESVASCSSLTLEEWQESVVQRQAEINAACSSFIKIGFHPGLFTIYNLHSYGFTETKFLELISPISFITDLHALSFLFNTARQSLYSRSVTPPNEFCDFVNCINWIKSELSERMNKKEMSKADVALARMLVHSAAPLMQQRRRIQSAIDELKKRQMVLETESERVSGELKLKLGPIYGYEEPSQAELTVECYLLYEEDCRSRGIYPIPKIDETTCGNLIDTVQERHLIKFLNDPVRKELIETYLKGFAAMNGGDGY